MVITDILLSVAPFVFPVVLALWMVWMVRLYPSP